MTSEHQIIITIDGPSGSGKTVCGQILAQKIKFFFLDTGAMYRALTWFCLHKNVNFYSENLVLRILNQIQFRLASNNKAIYLNHNRLGFKQLQHPKITEATQTVAAYHRVRKILHTRQKTLAKFYQKIIVVGRDIGSEVFPKATLKIFLTASLEARVRRRQGQLSKHFNHAAMSKPATLNHAMQERDHQDANRDFGRMTPAKDAITINNTNQSVLRTVHQIKRYLYHRLNWNEKK